MCIFDADGPDAEELGDYTDLTFPTAVALLAQDPKRIKKMFN